MRTWALISVLARAARLYSRFFPHAPAPPQLANKYDFLSELNVSGFLGLNLPYLSFWAVYRHMATISLVPLFG